MENKVNETDDCVRLGGLISEYIDGELDSETAERVRRHIDGCADCRKLYCDLVEVCRAAAESEYEPPRELHDRIMSAIEAERAGSKGKRSGLMRRRITAYAGIGVAAMLCVSIGATALVKNMINRADGMLAGETLAGANAEMSVGDINGVMLYRDDNSKGMSVSGKDQQAADKYSTADELKSDDTERGTVDVAESAAEVIPAECTDALPEQTKAAMTTAVCASPAETEAVYSKTEATEAGPAPMVTTAAPAMTAAPSASRPNDDAVAESCLGTWYFIAERGGYSLTFHADGSFTLVHTDSGSRTEGSFEWYGEEIIFRYNGREARYSYELNDRGLNLVYLSGERLF